MKNLNDKNSRYQDGEIINLTDREFLLETNKEQIEAEDAPNRPHRTNSRQVDDFTSLQYTDERLADNLEDKNDVENDLEEMMKNYKTDDDRLKESSAVDDDDDDDFRDDNLHRAGKISETLDDGIFNKSKYAGEYKDYENLDDEYLQISETVSDHEEKERIPKGGNLSSMKDELEKSTNSDQSTSIDLSEIDGDQDFSELGYTVDDNLRASERFDQMHDSSESIHNDTMHLSSLDSNQKIASLINSPQPVYIKIKLENDNLAEQLENIHLDQTLEVKHSQNSQLFIGERAIAGIKNIVVKGNNLSISVDNILI